MAFECKLLTFCHIILMIIQINSMTFAGVYATDSSQHRLTLVYVIRTNKITRGEKPVLFMAKLTYVRLAQKIQTRLRGLFYMFISKSVNPPAMVIVISLLVCWWCQEKLAMLVSPADPPGLRGLTERSRAAGGSPPSPPPPSSLGSPRRSARRRTELERWREPRRFCLDGMVNFLFFL